MQIYRLIYLSCSKLSGDPFAVRMALQHLLDHSRGSNAEKNITGTLLFSGNHFAQVLEGTHHSLVNLFEAIEADERHTSVTLMSFEPVDRREFAGWSMAIKELTRDDIPRFEGFGPNRKILKRTLAGGNIVDFLEFLLVSKEHQLETITQLVREASDPDYRRKLLRMTSHEIEW